MCRAFPEDDITEVMDNTDFEVTKRWAIWALQLHDGDIDDAIDELDTNEEIIRIMEKEKKEQEKEMIEVD